jgi:hypothetical protein
VASKKKAKPRGAAWTPKLRSFVDALKAGDAPTEAARKTKYSYPEKVSYRLINHPLVVAEMTAHALIQRKAEQRAADGIAKKTAVSKAAVLARLWDIANMNAQETNGTMNAQVRAGGILVEVLGMKIGAQNPDKFEGFTDTELERYAKDGTVPDRFASRFGVAPGSPSQVM